MRYIRTTGAIAALLAFGSFASGQTTYATLTGTVTDPSQGIVPGVKLAATNLQTNVKTTTVSNRSGDYTIPQLIEGRYILTAEAPGFAVFTADNIQLVSRDIRRVDVTMKVGSTATSINVSDKGATLIETETSRINDTKNANTLNIMPMNARNLWAYFEQVPTMISNGITFRLGGAPPTQTNFSIDGTTMNDGQGYQVGPQMNYMEYVQEVKVNLANNGAEFGTIGQVEAITKSGTNQLHGSAYDTFMTPGLRARNFFSSTVSPSRFHILGGSLAGPVYIPKIYNGKNKTFFFGSYERSDGNVASSNLNPTVPLAAWRNGDFSGLPPGTIIYDPTTNTPFNGNRIPTSRINPVSQGIQDQFYPLPNQGDASVFQTSNFRQNVTIPWQSPWLGTGRVDHYFSAKDFVYGRFMLTGAPGIWYEDNLPTIGLHNQYRTTRSATVSYTHVFGPTTINEARWGVDFNNIPSTGPVNGPQQVSKLGLTGLAPDLPDVSGMLNIGWDGIGLQPLTQSNGADPGYRNHNEQFQDYLTLVRGRHTIKFGFDIGRAEGDDYTVPTDLFGSETFSSRFTSGGISGQGSPYADFLLGIPTTSSRSYPSLLLERNRWMYAGFISDEFKVNRKLTVTAGLRYQLHTPWRENHGRIAAFDIGTGSIVVPNQSANQVSPLFPIGYVSVIGASAAHLPDTLIRADKSNFAPRFGVAWRPFGENTVFRAGYGIYYDVVPPDFSTAASPFQLHEPSYTNSVTNPQVIFPQVFPANPGAEGYAQVSLPNAVNPGLKIPYSQQYNFTIERQQWNTGFRASYIGTAVRQALYFYNYNSPVPDSRPFIDKARPFMQYPNINYMTNGGGGQYNALSAEVKRSMANGLYLQFAWTWARDRYDTTNATSLWDTIENPFDRQREVGVAQEIPTHRIQANGYYELPFGRGKPIAGHISRWANTLVGGWVISAVYGYNSGQFLTPMWTGPDPTGTAYTPNSTVPFVTIRPNQLGDPNIGARSIGQWFDPSAFGAPSPGRFGSAAKGVIKGPPSNSWNAGLQKQLYFGERMRAILEITSRNVFNHPNWSNPDTNISNTGSVGHITYAGGISDNSYEREERLGLRIEF